MLPVSGKDWTPVAIDWLWPGYLAAGSLTILDGDPGQGKSLLTLDLAARLTRGRPWPGGGACASPADVLLMCSEDPDSLILARLGAMGADLQRVHRWPREQGAELPRLPSEIPRLREALKLTGAKLLIIDPVMAVLDRNVNASVDASVRSALQPLAQAAHEHACAVVLVRHLNKHGGSQALYRGGGSIAFVATCRFAWLVARDPHRFERLVLAQVKNNFAARQPSLAYALSRPGPGIDWIGASVCAADELVSRRNRAARDRACAFLLATLATGPRTSAHIKEAARASKLSKATIRRAKDDLAIRVERVLSKGQRCDFWLLPHQQVPEGASDTPVLDAQLRQLEEQARGLEGLEPTSAKQMHPLDMEL